MPVGAWERVDQLARVGQTALLIKPAVGGVLILAEALHNRPAALTVARGEGVAGVFTTKAVDCTPSGRGGELCAISAWGTGCNWSTVASSAKFVIGPLLSAAAVGYLVYEHRHQGGDGRHSRRRGDPRES